VFKFGTLYADIMKKKRKLKQTKIINRKRKT